MEESIKSQGVSFCSIHSTQSFASPFALSLSLSPKILEMEGDDQERAASSTKERRRKFKRICVFCGSRAGHKSAFSDAALQLGNQLVQFIYMIVLAHAHSYAHIRSKAVFGS